MSRYKVPLLLAGMIITGSSNSLWTKWQDMQCVEDCDTSEPVLFEQPVWQTLQMFVGEMFCFLPVLYTWLVSRSKASAVRLPSEEDDAIQLKSPDGPRPLHGWSMLLLWIPAACDLTATTLMNVGLLYTPVSIYQMSRGALVLFVGILSVIFLRRHLWFYQWLSLVTVMVGIALVGLSGSMISEVATNALVAILEGKAPEPTEPQAGAVVIGVFFILVAQIFTAAQFVVEEKILAKYTVAPLVAVGLEGFFGFISILLLLPILSIPAISSKSVYLDLPRGWHQMISTPTVLWSSLAIACSISLFNYCGLSVTRHVSATARSLADTCRTLSIWIISLGLGWERLIFPISLLQIIGFSLLVYGTFVFNNLISPPPCIPGHPPAADVELDAEADERTALLSHSHSALDETATLPADLGQGGFDVIPESRPAARGTNEA